LPGAFLSCRPLSSSFQEMKELEIEKRTFFLYPEIRAFYSFR
jgi:hypothetical protein